MAKHDETGPIARCYDCGALLYASLGQCDICRLKGRIAELEAENKQEYRKGYNDGLTAFAWWKDGVQYVGTCGITLKQAMKGGDK